ncbi:MAG: hypothetical protein HFJ28_02970 [Clostridia bacterium]|nr:hypothetical protein [Clostridia bacterium]
MSKIKRILILFFILLVAFSSICMATNTTRTSEKTSATNKTASIINTDLYLAQDTIVLEDTINANAFVYGKTVTITGTIHGDLLVAANALIIDETANISGNLFAFASAISFKGTANTVYAFSQNFNLETTGSITRDLRLYSSNFTLAGTVERDAYLSVGKIAFDSNATSSLIKGNLHYAAQEEMNIAKDFVAGEIKFTQTSSNELELSQIIMNYVTSFINVLIYAIAVILICIFLTPKFVDKATYCLEKKAFITAGIGIAAIVLLPILCLILISTGYLLYVGVALLALTILIFSMTISIFGISIGNFIANKLKNKTKGKIILWSLVSVIAIWLLQKIPYIGGWISIFTVVFGLGTFIYSLFIRKDIS